MIKLKKIIVETGEPDQEYDSSAYDAICAALKQAGFNAYHREFDKYQGVYIKVQGVDTFWTTDTYVRGQNADTNQYQYSTVYLDGQNGQYSADPGDYWNVPPGYVFKNNTLVMHKLGEGTETIDNPTIEDLKRVAPHTRPSTMSFVKGTEVFVFEFSPESNPEDAIRVDYREGQGVDADELIQYCIANKRGGISESLRTLIENKVSTILKEEFGDDEYHQSEWVLKAFNKGKYWNHWTYPEDQTPEMLEHLSELLGLNFDVQLTEDGIPVNYYERWPEFFPDTVKGKPWVRQAPIMDVVGEEKEPEIDKEKAMKFLKKKYGKFARHFRFPDDKVDQKAEEEKLKRIKNQ